MRRHLRNTWIRSYCSIGIPIPLAVSIKRVSISICVVMPMGSVRVKLLVVVAIRCPWHVLHVQKGPQLLDDLSHLRS